MAVAYTALAQRRALKRDLCGGASLFGIYTRERERDSGAKPSGEPTEVVVSRRRLVERVRRMSRDSIIHTTAARWPLGAV